MDQNHAYQTRVATPRPAPTSGRVDTAPVKGISTQTAARKRRTGAKMLLFGAMSIASYVFLFANERLVTQTFTLGGWHAAYPVLTAFFFSFVHGAFASNLLSFIGLEAKKS